MVDIFLFVVIHLHFQRSRRSSSNFFLIFKDLFLILYLFLEDSFTFARGTIDLRSVQWQIKEVSSRITAISFNLDLLTNPRAVRRER